MKQIYRTRPFKSGLDFNGDPAQKKVYGPFLCFNGVYYVFHENEVQKYKKTKSVSVMH